MLSDEVAPSTVVYRSEGARTSLQQLIDSGAYGGSDGQMSEGSTSGGAATDGLAAHKVVPPPTTSNLSLSGGEGKMGEEADPATAAAAAASGASKLSWTQGVFVPCLLNIWGVIMFLRLGWVVGQAGILLACLIVFASKVVTTLTALSLCAICTNGEVKGGGVYFLISRALGPVYGGAIGVLFFLAQAVATSLYVIGFAESLSVLLVDAGVPFITGSELNDIRVLGLITTVMLLGVALVGVSWYAKCQIGLLVTLLVSMMSVLIGAFFPDIPNAVENEEAGFVGFGIRNLHASFTTDPATPTTTQDFFTVFAVFFPAATGVMAGANLSGDLKDPSVAIPKGTLGAIGLTFVSYIGLIWVVGTACLVCSDVDGEEFCMSMDTAAQTGNVPDGGLIFNKLIMQNMSIWAPLLYMGVFAATLSSALASLVGAPRILQSVAADKLFPWPWFNYFGAGHGPSNEPVRAYVLTFVICCGCVVIGSLDVIAPLISNFFMVSYAFTNYACFASSIAHYPGWRPSFKYYNKWLSLFGFLLCLVVMFLMDWATSLLTCALACMLYSYLLWLDPAVNWGAAGEARKYFSTLKGMEELQRISTDHVKTFRPQFLVMSGQPGERRGLIKFVSLLKKGGGIMICGDVVIDSHLEGGAVNVGGAVPAPPASPNGVSLRLANIAEDDGEEEDDEDTAEDDGATQAESSSKPAPTDPLQQQQPQQEDGDAHMELASRLALRLATVHQRRQAGEDFLSDKSIWGGRRCPGAFFDAVVGDTLIDGFQSLLQCAGVGRMRPNTVVLGFKTNWRTEPQACVKEYESIIRIAMSSNMGLMIVRDDFNIFDVDTVAPSGKALGFIPPRKNTAASAGTSITNWSDSDLESNESPTEAASAAAAAPGAASGGASPRAGGTVRPSIQRTLSCPRSNLQGDTIDVWWVSDDGGLTMLIPHLLKENRVMRNHKKLRVLTLTDNNMEETSKLQKTEFRMVHLLNKFRINSTVEAVEADLSAKASPDMVREFEQTSGLKFDDLSASECAKTHEMLRLADLMREHSSGPNTCMAFVTAPIPQTGLRVGLYTAWLDLLSKGMPPTIMMRGNQENVLTFIC